MSSAPKTPHDVPWTAWRFFRFSLLWLAILALWTALLSVVLPKMADGMAAQPNAWGRGALLALFSAVGAVVSGTTQILVGWRSDLDRSPWRRWKYLLGGFPLTLVPLLMLSGAQRPAQVLTALVLLQILANLATGPYQALIPDEVPASRHGIASTWLGLFQHAGQIVGPLLAALLLGANLAGLPRLLAVLYGGLLLGLLGLWTALPPRSLPAELPPSGSLSLTEGLTTALGQNPSFRMVLGSRLVINVGFYLVVYFLLFYVQYSLGADRPEDATATMLACMVGGGLLGGLLIGPRADKGKKLPLIYLTCGVTALGMAGFVATPHGCLNAARLFAVLAGFGFGGFSVVDWSLACNLAPRSSSALSMGVWNLAAVVPQVIAPGVFGPASDAMALHWGSGVAYRVVMAFVMVFLGLGSFRLRKLSESDLNSEAGLPTLEDDFTTVNKF